MAKTIIYASIFDDIKQPVQFLLAHKKQIKRLEECSLFKVFMQETEKEKI